MNADSDDQNNRVLDPSRPINDNCGWQHVLTDLLTFHDYTPAHQLSKTCSSLPGILAPKSGNLVIVEAITDSEDNDAAGSVIDGAPVICTEFGGINIQPGEESEGKEGDWGYTTAADSEDLLRRIEGMVMGIVEGGICCGLVYTQLYAPLLLFSFSLCVLLLIAYFTACFDREEEC